MIPRKIAVITGSRAEYGLLQPVIALISECPETELQLVVTGSHFSENHGNTISQIRDDGFLDFDEVDIPEQYQNEGNIGKAVSEGISRFTYLFKKNMPDLILILGDRFEIFSVAIAACFIKIPIAHVHGGEITLGSFDDYIRHSITKLSHLHFASTEEYKKRICQLGEPPNRVFNYGSLGVENILSKTLLSKQNVEKLLGVKFHSKNILVVIHPETLGLKPEVFMPHFFDAISEFKDIQFFFTFSNCDPGGDFINQSIVEFCSKNNNSLFFRNLGTINFLSLMSQVDGIIGNSSSSIIEAPTLKIGSINIGLRQQGRIKALSVLDCKWDKKSIIDAFAKLYSKVFQDSLKKVVNPYQQADSAKRIFDVIKKFNIENICQKKFHDLHK